ncbi:L-serine ammonia-lyase [Agromyces atrinae]|uniref:L-serine dehydratase n=1 Tax=Agromyces atrinae TaxID=592376 RepID=A0A4Q2M3S2_9MICO|nr:L-serine ammonia-lyase [Agromyces atrinae]NYD68763.1 L-serine dehydratase [Agromyces atrinae]RXZ85062.1 L-serine ammonia-lyase [Agromyces atrinae]RXZ85857.1 L-serine ammonia-lyase [Agromyces atrinae]
MTAFVSALDLFSIGIGPSSSHTVGPMRAARAFATELAEKAVLTRTARIVCTLYGSLGATGVGHGTPGAVIAGLGGAEPETCDPDAVRTLWESCPVRLALSGGHTIDLSASDIEFEPRTRLPGHSNGLRFAALDDEGDVLHAATFYSVGGGFITRAQDDGRAAAVGRSASSAPPLPYSSAAELLALCDSEAVSMCDVAYRNEVAFHGAPRIEEGLDAIWAAMSECVDRGLDRSGTLPGGLGVRRRAASVRERLDDYDLTAHERDTSTEWLHAFALAVNEENASGGRVVTAPTNGAAGIIPAVGRYYLRFVPGADAGGIRRYLLTATAIGSLFKANASISGAEGGCQAEVGSACAMAAGGLCAVLGGTPHQIENAAEIAMEHHLGLTCDPVGGLVQVPCIERNAIAASTAVSAARLALHGDGSHIVSLDAVIETMRQTGLDMKTKYKETSRGGLAVNVIEC